MSDTPQVYVSSTPPKRDPFWKSKKLVVAVVAVIVLGEIGWTLSTLSKPVGSKTAQSVASPPAQKVTAKLILSRLDSSEIKVGSSFNVAITEESPAPTDGVDVILKYDPKVLSAEPVKVTQIYSQYPVNSVDAEAGRVILSGIKTIKGEGFVGRSELGTITFKAISAGQTAISFDYQPSSTTDSNIIDSLSGQDILEEVTNLNLQVQ